MIIDNGPVFKLFAALPTSLPWRKVCWRIREFCSSSCLPGDLLNLVNRSEDTWRNSHKFFGFNKFVFNTTVRQ